MMRRNLPTDGRGSALKTLSMLVVFAVVAGTVIHALTHRDATSIVSAGTLLDPRNQMPMVP